MLDIYKTLTHISQLTLNNKLQRLISQIKILYIKDRKSKLSSKTYCE